MSIFDAFHNLLGGSGTRTVLVRLESGEVEITRAVAALRPGTITSVGGDLVLTNRRLVFTPLDVRDVIELLTWGLDKTSAPALGTQLPAKVGELVRQEPIGALNGIVDVLAGSGPTLTRPPTLMVLASDGTHTEIGILSGRRSLSLSRSNVVERDRILAAVRSAQSASPT